MNQAFFLARTALALEQLERVRAAEPRWAKYVPYRGPRLTVFLTLNRNWRRRA